MDERADDSADDHDPSGDEREVYLFEDDGGWIVQTEAGADRYPDQRSAGRAARDQARRLAPSRVVNRRPSSPPSGAELTVAAPDASAGPPDWERLAGPLPLGRAVIVADGQPVPAPWRQAPVIEIRSEDHLHDPDLLDQVRRRFVGRLPTVYVVPADLAGPAPAVCDDEVWTVPVDVTFTAEATWELLSANALDSRRADGAGCWPPADLARSAGARTVRGPDADGDVVLPDGTPAWCDGGPVRRWRPGELGDVGALPRFAIEVGHLVTMGAAATSATLDDSQLAAVDDPGGAAAVLAPAGSGKTRVLTERVRHLVRDWRLPARSLCIVAFNVRAKNEMRSRTADMGDLQIQTLNSLALSIVDGRPPFAPQPRRVRTADERAARDLLQQVVDLPRRANTDPAAAWLEALASVRLGLRDPAEVEEEFAGDVDGLTEVVPRYRQLLADRDLVDFDDQIYRALEILLRDPDARRRAQRACRLLLVDEFQDLTPAHVLLLRLLAGPHADVFAVGDDDQTIYGYTGASPDWLINFERYFPGAARHLLDTNYRCPPEVVAATRHLLSWNRRRVDKDIHARPEAAPDSEALRIDRSNDALRSTVDVVHHLVDGGTTPSDIAVLTRVNALLAPVQVALRSSGVPVVAAVDRRFLERTGVAAALSWLRLATRSGRLDPADVANAARRPARALSPRVVQWMGEQSSIDGLERLAGRLKGRDNDKVTGFAGDLRALVARADSGGSTSDLLEQVRSQIGLDGAMGTLDLARRRVDRSSQLDDLRALISLAHLQPDPAAFGPWLRDHLPDQLAPPDPGGGTGAGPARSTGVQLATVHKVKGLEWPYVVVHEASAGLFPHRLASDIEEERRVFHVAVTRARTSLTIVADVTAPSPFLDELTRTRSADDTTPDAPRSRDLPRRTAGPSGARRRPASPAAVPDLDPVGQRLLESLKAWRRERSQSDRVPAYVVASDRTLLEVAARRPGSPDELLTITGIGPAKLDRYGDELLGVVSDGG